MYPHGGSGNRGCEAIVRGTIKILETKNSVLFSSQVLQDKKVKLEEICDIENERILINKYSLNYIMAYFKYHCLGKKKEFDILTFKNIINECNQDTIALSIGGDNYCYGDADYIYLINEQIRKKGCKNILWGCSVDEKQLTPKMIEDLKGYDLIVARESITYNSMKKINSNVVLYPDPAFQLDKIELSLPDKFYKYNTVGINVSPMIIDNEKNQGMAMKNYKALIEYIIENTDMQIALIPHVIWDFNDDRKPIEVLYEKYKNTGRIVKIDGYSARELKGFISKCRFFVGARTHSTIAAYSSCVPTLVVGYSVKARGIAKDLFGTDKNYVLPVQSLERENDLINSFVWIKDNEDLIKRHLESFIPEYNQRTLELKDVIECL